MKINTPILRLIKIVNYNYKLINPQDRQLCKFNYVTNEYLHTSFLIFYNNNQGREETLDFKLHWY